MIHTIYSMTLGRYAEMESTENVGLLRKWFNPFPVKWFDTSLFFDEFNNMFGNPNNINTEIYKSATWNTIQMLDAMYKTSLILMKAQNQSTLFNIIFKRKFKDMKSNLEEYRQRIKKITRIDIFDKNGLERLAKEIQRRIDKYNERNVKKESKPVDFMEFVYGVFNVCEMPYNPTMTLFEFAKLRHRADKIIKQRDARNK